MKKERKASKEHKCMGCDFPIRPNGIYVEWKARIPREDTKGNQVGIEYIYERYHRWCLENLTFPLPKNAEKHCCVWETEYERDGYVDCWPVYVPTGKEFCKICLDVREKN